MNINWKKDTVDGGDHLKYQRSPKKLPPISVNTSKTNMAFLTAAENQKYKQWDNDVLRIPQIVKIKHEVINIILF